MRRGLTERSCLCPRTDYAAIVQEAIDEHVSLPVDILNTGHPEGEHAYVTTLKDSYVRTLRDIEDLCGRARDHTRVLELGAFLGVVSVALRKLGYDVRASDIPEFHRSPGLRELYHRHGIPFDGFNLRTEHFPYDEEAFDLVVACEVLEHLNFNPLPALLEINRILRVGGRFYIAMPNQAALDKRLALLRGRSVRNPIGDYSKQLDSRDNMIVGLHWREYTLSETVELVETMGFRVTAGYYFSEEGRQRRPGLKGWIKEALYSYPPLRPSQVVIAEKVALPLRDFWLTDANS